MNIKDLNLSEILGEEVKTTIEEEFGFDSTNQIFAQTIMEVDRQNAEAGLFDPTMEELLSIAYDLDDVGQSYSIGKFAMSEGTEDEKNTDEMVLFGLPIDDFNNAFNVTNIVSIPSVLFNYAIRLGYDPNEFILNYIDVMNDYANVAAYEIIDARNHQASSKKCYTKTQK